VQGLFVTGTGTGVGKTVLSASLLAAIAATGRPVRAHKPVLTGLEEHQPGAAPPGRWPPDHELLAAAAGMAPEDVAPLRYHPAVSPHLAAKLAGEQLDPAQMLAAARSAVHTPTHTTAAPHSRTAPLCETVAQTDESFVIVEGVGGLLVPLANDYTVRDLAVQLALPLLIAAPPGLGTINHTLLTLHAARSAGLEVHAVVLTPWPEQPSTMEHSNRQTISHLGAIEVWGLPHISSPDPAALARAGAALPVDRWLSHPARVNDN
jgi:dethiobiotin synthetase